MISHTVLYTGVLISP